MICNRIEDCKKVELDKSKDTWKDSKGCDSKYLIENKSKKTYYKIDFENYVYENKQNETKCDYGLLTEDTIYFVELKGRNISKGIKQLYATLLETEKCFNGLNKKARIVASKIHRPDLMKRDKEYKYLVKKTKEEPIFSTKQYTEKI